MARTDSPTTDKMTYPENFEIKIGFDRIVSEVAERCTVPAAKERLLAQKFTDDAGTLQLRLDLADQMRSILMMESGFPNEEFCDIEPVVAKLRIEGSFLDAEQARLLRSALLQIEAVAGFILSRDRTAYPDLRHLSEEVEPLAAIANHIDSIIDEFAQVRDSASDELYRIRRAIRDREGLAAKRLQQVLQSAKSAGFVDPEATLSVRDGRTVIPVAAGNKRKVAGFVQGESATGKTVYIEPIEVVELNNELKELEYAERRETVRILTELTETIRPDTDSIERSADYLATIDMLRAKARFALANGCAKPIISFDGRYELRNARHPLLAQTLAREGKTIVPLDASLDSTKRILVISGPNAGGKSVCLKTVGLLQYMFQCGFLIPCSENSELPLFQSIFIDIGDEQSIDNDLSTYSSHLLNMKHMLAGASPRSLVLIDEFGSGTEPVMGAAIAEAILEQLVERGTYGVITTHYSNIKYYASNHEGVVNGAMMFDVQNIRPLFKLEMGKPGSSFAVEIARKIGLPESIIRSASDKVGSDHINIEKQLREIARDRRYWEQKRDRIRIADRKVEELEQDYAEQLSRIRTERQQIIREAKEEAKRLLADTNKQIENTIRTIRESQAEKEATRSARQALEELRERTEQDEQTDAERSARVEQEMARIERRRQRRAERRASAAGTQTVETPAETAVPKQITVGTKVRIKDQDNVGEVQAIKGKKATVAFGQILTTIDMERLEAVSNAEYKRHTRPVTPRTVVSVDVSQRRLNFRDHIDVRGMRAAEALEAVQSFIDDAVMVDIGSVTILHGKGTGALKEEIRRYLRTVPEVESFADEHADRGGAGITIVKFRNGN